MNRNEALLVVCSLLFVTALYVSIRDPLPHADEMVHFDQMRRYIEGNPRRNPLVTTFSVLHYLLSLPGRIYPPAGQLSWLRVFTFCLSSVSIVAVYRLARLLNASSAPIRTMQFAFFPICFPLFFVIYTDLPSLACVIAAVYWTDRRRYNLAGLAAAAALLIRQNNIIWILFCCVLILHQEGAVIPSLRKGWRFLLILVAFAIFVIVNQGVAIGDKSRHPWTLSTGNVFFMLLLFFIFFLPVHLARARAIVQLLKQRKSLIALIPVTFFIYMLTFVPTNFYNQSAYSFFLHNKLLLLMDSSLLYKSLFFLPMIYSVFTLMVTPLVARRYYWLYPTSVLFVAPSWLIEQRYYLIPFTLFLLARTDEKPAVENLLLLLYIPAALFFMFGITTGRFFL